MERRIDKEYLYEKIAEISDKKSELLEENEELKKQLNEYNENIFNDFCEFVNILIEKIDFSKTEQLDEFFRGKSKEDMMARFFIRAIQDKANKEGVDPKEVVRSISRMLRVF